MIFNAGIKCLAVHFPSVVRTNDYFRARYPEVLAEHEDKTLGKLWRCQGSPAEERDAFTAEMARYVADPFRGTVERRVLAPGERALTLELGAARQALSAGRLSPEDIDLLLSVSFPADQIGVGDAVFLARELGLRHAAWNLESACSGALIALETACALVQAGHHKNALVVVSCTYSRVSDESDSLSWFLGDGAAAFVVSAVEPGFGLLGTRTVHTAETCDTFSFRLEEERGQGTVRMRSTPQAGKVLGETSEPYLRECALGAAKAAGVRLAELRFFVFATPTAWFGAFAARALGISEGSWLTTYPRYANIGPALMPTNLHQAASEGRIKKGDLVLLYTVGSVASASAAILRWGDVALGPLPSPFQPSSR